MESTDPVLTASEAAARLGVSQKALRLYEARGLIAPARTAAGWRCYRPSDLETASQVVALRKLGLSLRRIERALDGDAASLEPALAAHEQELGRRAQELLDKAARVRRALAEMRDLARRAPSGGPSAAPTDLADLLEAVPQIAVSFALPWPWGGERFDLRRPQPLTFLIGPLASGKTRLAKTIADALPDASFLGLERLERRADRLQPQLASAPRLAARVEAALEWLAEEGAETCDALPALAAELEAEAPAHLVVDLIEAGFSAATQEALGAYLRRRARRGRALFVMTRSTAVFDLEQAEPGTDIIFCPPNHSPPVYVPPVRGAAGYEAVRLCLAPPDVRERTKDVVAIIRREDP